VSDYVLFMCNRRIVEGDRAESIFRSPSSELTERYIKGVFG